MATIRIPGMFKVLIGAGLALGPGCSSDLGSKPQQAPRAGEPIVSNDIVSPRGEIQGYVIPSVPGMAPKAVLWPPAAHPDAIVSTGEQPSQVFGDYMRGIFAPVKAVADAAAEGVGLALSGGATAPGVIVNSEGGRGGRGGTGQDQRTPVTAIQDGTGNSIDLGGNGSPMRGRGRVGPRASGNNY